MKAEEFTEQVVQAVGGTLTAEQLEKIRFLCEKYAVENAYTDTLRRMVKITLEAQQTYFKTRDTVDLQKSKEHEQRLAKLAAIEPKQIRYTQKELFS